MAEKIKDSKGDGINDGNSKFNAKLDRHYGKYTKEIKANLERGTALPRTLTLRRRRFVFHFYFS